MDYGNLYNHGVAVDFISKLIPPATSKRKTRIAFFSVAIEVHFDWALAKKTNLFIASKARDLLPDTQYEFVTAEEPFQDHLALRSFLDDAAHEGLDGIILCHAAYTTGEIASQLGAWLAKHQIPIFSFAMPEPMGAGQNLSANRLCSQNFVLGILNKLNVRYQWLFCPPDDEMFEVELVRFARSCRTLSNIKGRKALIAGAGRVPGFYDCEVNEIAVLKKLELGFDRVNLVDITSRMPGFAQSDINEIKQIILNDPDCKFNNVPDRQIDDSIRLALSLMTVAREGNYLGISFKNWPELFEHFHIAGDGAMALCNDQGILVSDEADSGALITMIIMDQISESSAVPLLSDISYLSGDGTRLGVWHNGSGATKLRKQGTGFEVRKHGILENYDFETAWGMLFEFLLQTGPVTIAKYQSPDIASVLAFEGELVDTDMKFRGTYGEVLTEGHSAAAIVGTILDQGLDHHWVVGRGHFLRDLQLFNYWTGISDIEVFNDGQSAGLGRI